MFKSYFCVKNICDKKANNTNSNNTNSIKEGTCFYQKYEEENKKRYCSFEQKSCKRLWFHISFGKRIQIEDFYKKYLKR
jgi:hypothetical protein